MFIVMYQSLRPEEMEFLSRWQIIPGEIYEKRDSRPISLLTVARVVHNATQL